MKKTVFILILVFVLSLGGCTGRKNTADGEFMPEVKNSGDIFEIYDYQEQKLIKSIDMYSDESVRLICDSIVNNVDNGVNYLSQMDNIVPDYLLLYCGENRDECIYVKLRLADGKVYRQIYGASGNALTLDQGILECIAVTEDEFLGILE